MSRNKTASSTVKHLKGAGTYLSRMTGKGGHKGGYAGYSERDVTNMFAAFKQKGTKDIGFDEIKRFMIKQAQTYNKRMERMEKAGLADKNPVYQMAKLDNAIDTGNGKPRISISKLKKMDESKINTMESMMKQMGSVLDNVGSTVRGYTKALEELSTLRKNLEEAVGYKTKEDLLYDLYTTDLWKMAVEGDSSKLLSKQIRNSVESSLEEGYDLITSFGMALQLQLPDINIDTFLNDDYIV